MNKRVQPVHHPAAMAFSGAVRITDLNDFIAPSQACVVALNGKPSQGGGGGSGRAAVQLLEVSVFDATTTSSHSLHSTP